ncbi:DNA gyrase inhibitor [Leucobacter sp. Psy1]|uniref:GyrI-like domain-containing protein n=1 Tax=Leucobacter sp. Psy1 TaxID=2875729 RepID=UPI001CD25FA2|nr:GyrI-like domain-containing protein [Leucobacter sp. Psy1]UBH07337.1 DNA gyrase inhibitor [Leucobacter sp. Psy1]
MTLDIAIEDRQAVQYIGATFSARPSEFGAPDGPNDAIPKVYQWLEEHGIAPLGGPLYVHRHVGSSDDIVDLTVAVPIAAPVKPTDGLVLGELPAGTYVIGHHVGAPDAIPGAHEEMKKWAEEHGHRLDCREDDNGTLWTGYAEHFLTDPSQEPDPTKWVTDLLFKTV